MSPLAIVLAVFVAAWLAFAVVASKAGWSRTVGFAGGGFFAAGLTFVLFVTLAAVGVIPPQGSRAPGRNADRSSVEVAEPAVEAPTFQAATDAQLEEIRFFLRDGFSIRHAYTARSKATRGGYFVAAEITHSDASPGMYFSGGDVALWYHTGKPDDVGQVLAVDSLADDACTCFYARDTEAELIPADAFDLTSHVRSRLR